MCVMLMMAKFSILTSYIALHSEISFDDRCFEITAITINWLSHNPNNDPTFQIYANSEIMLERSQSFIAKNTVHVRKVSNVIDEVWIYQ